MRSITMRHSYPEAITSSLRLTTIHGQLQLDWSDKLQAYNSDQEANFHLEESKQLSVLMDCEEGAAK